MSLQALFYLKEKKPIVSSMSESGPKITLETHKVGG